MVIVGLKIGVLLGSFLSSDEINICVRDCHLKLMQMVQFSFYSSPVFLVFPMINNQVKYISLYPRCHLHLSTYLEIGRLVCVSSGHSV